MKFARTAFAVIFVVATIVPYVLTGEWPPRLQTIQVWQTWYGALLGFTGLIFATLYNGAAQRKRDEDIHKQECYALALAFAWQTFSIVQRAHWSQGCIEKLIENIKQQGTPLGWKEGTDQDINFKSATSHKLETHIPDPSLLQNLIIEAGKLPSISGKLANFTNLTSVARQSIKGIFRQDDNGRFSLNEFVISCNWLKEIQKEGLELFGEIAGQFPEMSDQLKYFEKQAKQPSDAADKDSPPIVIDSTTWTGLQQN